MNTIASFFAGIMTFVSSLLGYESGQPIAVSTAEQIAIKQESTLVSTSTITSATTSQSGVASSTGKLTTYHSDLFGYEIQYPKEWNLHNDKGTIYLDDPSQKDSKNEPATVLSISAHQIDKRRSNSVSLDEWFTYDFLGFSSNKDISLIKKSFLFNEDVREVEEDVCGKNIAIAHSGVAFVIQYRNRGFNICDSNLSAIKSVVSSFKFVNQKTNQDIINTTFAPDYMHGTGELQDSKTEIISNDPIATIEKDFGYIDIVYTTKDKNKIYFYFPLETECAGIGCRRELGYLDVKEKRYHNPGFYVDPGCYEEGMPVIQLCANDVQSKDFYSSNMETGQKRSLYSNTNSGESLVDSCREYEEEGSVVAGYTNDIEYISGNKLRIGVYKNVGQDKKECTKETLGKYEKIRDDFVDLNKL